MNKTYINIIFVTLILLGAIASAVITSRDRTIDTELTLAQKQILKNIGITGYATSVYTIQDDLKEICLNKQDCSSVTYPYKEPIYDKDYNTVGYTDTSETKTYCTSRINNCWQFNSSKISSSDKEIEILKMIADAELNRTAKPEKEKIEEGVTIIK